MLKYINLELKHYLCTWKIKKGGLVLTCNVLIMTNIFHYFFLIVFQLFCRNFCQLIACDHDTIWQFFCNYLASPLNEPLRGILPYLKKNALVFGFLGSTSAFKHQLLSFFNEIIQSFSQIHIYPQPVY